MNYLLNCTVNPTSVTVPRRQIILLVIHLFITVSDITLKIKSDTNSVIKFYHGLPHMTCLTSQIQPSFAGVLLSVFY